MRIGIIATGSRGDVLPMLALATGLKTAGHHVRLFVEKANFEKACLLGFDCFLARGDSERFYSGPAGIAMRESLQQPISEMRRFFEAFIHPVAVASIEAGEELYAYEGLDALVCHSWLGYGPSIAEKFNLTCFLSSPLPMFLPPTGELAFPLSRKLNADQTAQQNLRSWRRQLPLLRVGHALLQSWRTKTLDLPPQTFRHSLDALGRQPLLLAYSPIVFPKAREWGDNVHVTGYWFERSTTDYQPSPELERFLARGRPPVVVGFGSHLSRDPDRLTRTVVEALLRAGLRGILIGGFGGLQTERKDFPEHVFGARSIPYDWLLPRTAGAVHHGGAGTTGVCLHAGVPQLVVPFGFDQPFWGLRMAAIGVAPRPIAGSELTVDSLTEALRQLVDDRSLRAKAQEIGCSLREERGIEMARLIIERRLRSSCGTTTV